MRRTTVTVVLSMLVSAMGSTGGALASHERPPSLTSLALNAGTVPAGAPVGVSGSMTVLEQEAVKLWTDGTLAADVPTFDYPTEPMLDLVEGSVQRARPGAPLVMSVKVNGAVAESGPKPYMRFRWPFHLGDIWYFVTFNYVQNGSSGGWQGIWYYCQLALGSACVHGTTPPFPVTFDPATRTFTGTIPIADLAAVQPSGALVQDTMRPFSTQYPPESGYAFPVLTWTQDRAAPFTPYDLPLESVFLAVAPAGTDPTTVDYSHADVTTSEGSLDVAFSGQVPTTDLAPGSYEVFVKACFGDCAFRRLPLTVT